MATRWIVVLSLLLLMTPAAAASRPVRTLATAQATITAFAQDGDSVSWSDGVVVRCGDEVVVRDLTGSAADRVSCGDPAARQLAVANGEVLWWKRFAREGIQYHDLLGMPNRGAHDLVLRRQWPRKWTVEFSLTGDGPVLGYGTWVAGPVDPKACRASGHRSACRLVVKEGGFYRVRGTRSRLVPGLPPTRLAAAAAGRVALVPAGRLGGSPRTRTSTVIVYAPSTAPSARQTSLNGRVRALAFDGRRVAVLVDDALVVWNERLRQRGFRRYHVAQSATALTMSSDAIVYRVGRSIRVVGRGEVAHAAAEPIDLAIEGHRIAWAENVHGRGRIQSVALSG